MTSSNSSLGSALLGLVLAACSEPRPAQPQGVQGTEPSPNASILPAPLASGVGMAPVADSSRIRDGGFPELEEAGVWVVGSFREDEPLVPDPLRPKDALGVTLEARFSWPTGAANSPSPDLNAAALPQLRQRSAFSIEVDLAPAGRMRFVLDGAAFPLPRGTEIRSRTEYYGHALVWPDGQSYRLIQPGALRTLLSERRCDVGPLVAAEASDSGSGQFLGLATRKVQLSSPLGRIALQQAALTGVEPAGMLLCRLLVELVGIDPAEPSCTPGLVPVRAEYAWQKGGRLLFEVSSILRPQELPLASLRVPPDNPHFKGDLLPVDGPTHLLSPTDLRQLHVRDSAEAQRDSTNGDSATPRTKATARNDTDTALYLLLDGVPVLWLRPSAEANLPGLRRGRYSVSWKDFLGREQRPPQATELPGKLEVGIPSDTGNSTVGGAPTPGPGSN